MKSAEFLELLFLKMRVFFYETWEWLKVLFFYYRDSTFRHIDLELLRAYFWESPYSISKEYLLSQGEQDPYNYGETPLTTLDLIAKRYGLSSKDTVYELGAGRCRSCFWLAHFIGCRVVGVEQIPFFIEQAERIKELYQVDRVQLLCGDFFEIPLSRATVIYLYGTTMEESAIGRLIRKFERLPKGTKIITVSYPLTDFIDFTNRDTFKVVDSFEGSFPWGKTDIFLQIVK